MTIRLILALMALCIGLGLVGCPSGNPATWTKADVEKYLKDKVPLTEVSLTQNEDGSYSGSGKKPDGTGVTVSVTQDLKADKLLYTVTDAAGKVSGGSVHY